VPGRESNLGQQKNRTWSNRRIEPGATEESNLGQQKNRTWGNRRIEPGATENRTWGNRRIEPGATGNRLTGQSLFIAGIVFGRKKKLIFFAIKQAS